MNDLVVIGNEDLMWIQEPFHINNGSLKLQTIIFKSSILNVVDLLDTCHDKLYENDKNFCKNWIYSFCHYEKVQIF